MPDKKLIYIIEDDNDTMELLYLILKNEYDIVQFPAANQAFFDQVDKRKPDLILIDFVTPQMNTVQTIKFIKDKYDKTIKIVLLSALNENILPKGILFDHYIAKPFQLKDLRTIIKSLLLIKLSK